jgi:hypothetical protein
MDSHTPSALLQLIMHEPELVMMVREISRRRPVGNSSKPFLRFSFICPGVPNALVDPGLMRPRVSGRALHQPARMIHDDSSRNGGVASRGPRRAE